MEMGVVNGQQRYDNFCISEHNYLDTDNDTYSIICIATEENTMEKELFGPIVTIYIYDDKDYSKVLKLVDSTSEYALTGAIFAKNRMIIENPIKGRNIS